MKKHGEFPRALLLPLILFGMTILVASCISDTQLAPIQTEKSWQSTLEQDLHLLGHRNWILVVDKAFPEQSSPGMKYLYVEQNLLPTLEYVLEEVEGSSQAVGT